MVLTKGELIGMGGVFCLTVFVLYVFVLLHHHARRARRNALKQPQTQALPTGSLPATELPIQLIFASMLVRKIANDTLTEPFYDRELADTSRYYLIHPMSLSSVCGEGMDVVFVAHSSRSATTLLCRMLDARGGVSTIREPSLLTHLLQSANEMPSPHECSDFLLARAVLQYFVQYSSSRGHLTTVVKLPSVASRPGVLSLLDLACPSARKISVQRKTEDIVESLRRTITPAEEKLTSEKMVVATQHKTRAANDWAEMFVTYDDIVFDLQGPAKICAAFGLPHPSEDQARRMLLERRIDAKTGAPR
uniref:Uncharacterized protein n=1 Tax=viral metagenome TaxID=1070528 RepID=A0A6C0C323_9ZZZZ